ncbi:hypothetical protein [Paracoccus sp. NSM]|uniref:hypothetical protein n=1 Tax=Paracoccus sp. NSM TaxID=3457784 RepID=UPI004036320E
MSSADRICGKNGRATAQMQNKIFDFVDFFIAAMEQLCGTFQSYHVRRMTAANPSLPAFANSFRRFGVRIPCRQAHRCVAKAFRMVDRSRPCDQLAQVARQGLKNAQMRGNWQPASTSLMPFQGLQQGESW